jgi:hypothetical protein
MPDLNFDSGEVSPKLAREIERALNLDVLISPLRIS